MTGPQNCPMCTSGPKVDNATCPCGRGYMTDEGTFIPGSLVGSGQALPRARYQEHKHCEVCKQTPAKCQRRKNMLLPQKTRRMEAYEQEGYVEFFLPGEGISPTVLRKYVEVNGGKDAWSQSGKWFKGAPGYTIKSRFRFNAGIIRELQDLTITERQTGEMSTRDVSRRASTTSRPFNEFTHYLTGDEQAISPSSDRSSTRHPERSSQALQNRHAPSQVPSSTQYSMPQRHVAHHDSDDDVPELTSATKHVSISDRHGRDNSPRGDAKPHHSRDDVSWKDQSSIAYSRDKALDEPRPRPTQVRYGGEEPGVSRHAIVSQDERRDDGRSEDFRQGDRGADSYDQARYGSGSVERPRDVTVRPERTGSDPSRRGSTYRDRHSKPTDGPSERHSSYSAQRSAHEVQQPSRRDAREGGSDDEDVIERGGRDFFVPSEKLDIVVLAFYLKFCVDSNARIVKTTHNGKEGFMIHASRAITSSELEDIMKDTKGWQIERRGLSSRIAYSESTTARQRLKKSGRSR